MLTAAVNRKAMPDEITTKSTQCCPLTTFQSDIQGSSTFAQRREDRVKSRKGEGELDGMWTGRLY